MSVLEIKSVGKIMSLYIFIYKEYMEETIELKSQNLFYTTHPRIEPNLMKYLPKNARVALVNL